MIRTTHRSAFTGAPTRMGFTLVELLVVIGVIAVLVSLLLPALMKARTKAKDVACASTMRQTLMAITMYNVQFKRGLQNYHPQCPFWGAGWPGGAPSGAHWLSAVPAGLNHAMAEARAGATYWRAYLLESRLLGQRNAAGVVTSSAGSGALSATIATPRSGNRPTACPAYRGSITSKQMDALTAFEPIRPLSGMGPGLSM